MGSIVFNPSTQQPVSVSVKTGAYTIPAGFYAYVTASVAGSDTFSIGGVVALQGVASSASAGTGGAISSIDVETTGTTTASYTVPSGYKAVFHLYQTSSAIINSSSGLISSTISIGSFSRSITIDSGSITETIGGTGFFSGGSLANSDYTWNAGSGEVISQTITFTGTAAPTTSIRNIFGYAERPNSLNGGQSAGVSSGSFWIAENTVLTTSGGQYTVSLYKNIA